MKYNKLKLKGYFMDTTLVVEKGYTIKVVSWENDGDNYNTITKTVATIEEAKAHFNLLNVDSDLVHQTLKYRDIRIGNSRVIKEKAKEKVFYLMVENGLASDDEDLDIVYNRFSEVYNNYCGYSEDYIHRVVDAVSITYSPEDIYLENITFNK